MSDKQPFTPPCPLHTAVLFLIYKRPDTTRQVFEAIRKAKPPRLYVVADGAKPDVPGEAVKVQQVRDLVLEGIDWECEVKTLFRDKNLGCKYGVSGGIKWFFEHEEMGQPRKLPPLPPKGGLGGPLACLSPLAYQEIRRQVFTQGVEMELT